MIKTPRQVGDARLATRPGFLSGRRWLRTYGAAPGTPSPHARVRLPRRLSSDRSMLYSEHAISLNCDSDNPPRRRASSAQIASRLAR